MIRHIVCDHDVPWGDDAGGSRRRASRLRLSIVVFLLTVVLWPLLGYATPIRQPAVPKDLEAAAVVGDMTGIRYWQLIWNIGETSASGSPEAVDLIHDILIASAAIPAAFPPTMIDVKVGGMPYQEMHVDGGASAQVYIYPTRLHVAELAKEAHITRERRVYVVRNSRLDSDWADTERRTFSTAERAITSLIQTPGVGDLYRIYATTERDSVDFNLAFIPESFDVPLTEPFEQHYMNALFNLGYELARAGFPWVKMPPGY